MRSVSTVVTVYNLKKELKWRARAWGFLWRQLLEDLSAPSIGERIEATSLSLQAKWEELQGSFHRLSGVGRVWGLIGKEIVRSDAGEKWKKGDWAALSQAMLKKGFNLHGHQMWAMWEVSQPGAFLKEFCPPGLPERGGGCELTSRTRSLGAYRSGDSWNLAIQRRTHLCSAGWLYIIWHLNEHTFEKEKNVMNKYTVAIGFNWNCPCH